MKYFGKNDNIMTNRGFLIFDYLGNTDASLIYQLFLNGREQLTKVGIKESQAIASVMIC